MIVDVTVNDIKRGKKSQSRECPVALAMSRVFGKRITVTPMFFCFSPEMSMSMSHVHIITPDEVRDWIVRFDQTGIGEPFTFEVTARP